MTILPYGDSALLINLDQRVSEDVHDQVMAMTQQIELIELHGVTYTIPAYCSITVGFDPLVTSYDKLAGQLRDIEANASALPLQSRHLHIPVCYEEPYAMDWQDVTKQTGLTPAQAIQLHTAQTYRVFMLGFLPGFVYLGKVPDALYCKRKETPRVRLPALSVGLAGHQTGIYPAGAPGGWQIIGRTPVPIFQGHESSPTLFLPGDTVTFRPVGVSAFEQVSRQVAAGAFSPDQLLL